MIKSIKKNNSTMAWIKDMDVTHMSTWLLCMTMSSNLEHAFDYEDRIKLAKLLD